MSNRNDVVNGLLVYTCNCGWIDKSHAVKTSNRPNVGAGSLWKQIKEETGKRSQLADGFPAEHQPQRRPPKPVTAVRERPAPPQIRFTEPDSFHRGL